MRITNVKSSITRYAIHNTRYDLQSTNSYVRNYKTFFAKRTQFPKSQMNVNIVITTNYEQRTMNYEIKNEPNRTQNEPKFKKAKMNLSAVITMNYEQLTMNCVQKNEPNLSRRSLLQSGISFGRFTHEKGQIRILEFYSKNNLTLCRYSLEYWAFDSR
jgi:hypothetical protein